MGSAVHSGGAQGARQNLENSSAIARTRRAGLYDDGGRRLMASTSGQGTARVSHVSSP